MKRWAAILFPVLTLLLFPRPVAADEAPFRTVIDKLIPATPGLTIEGAQGGCDFVLKNQTGQDVYFFDQSKPSKPIRFAAQPKSAQPRPPVAVHLAGAWPCASLPAVTEDQHWNNTRATVLIWSVAGSVGVVAFRMQAHTEYDPALDPAAQYMFYGRMAAGALAVGGFLMAIPYLLRRRREILGPQKKAA
ncbi:MAG TPA: hypothetical protein VGD57_00470 [Candidatus Dormibacteraeota bacterium]